MVSPCWESRYRYRLFVAAKIWLLSKRIHSLGELTGTQIVNDVANKVITDKVIDNARSDRQDKVLKFRRHDAFVRLIETMVRIINVLVRFKRDNVLANVVDCASSECTCVGICSSLTICIARFWHLEKVVLWSHSDTVWATILPVHRVHVIFTILKLLNLCCTDDRLNRHVFKLIIANVSRGWAITGVVNDVND